MQTELPAHDTLKPPASLARSLFDANRFEEAIAFCRKELPSVEKEIPARSQRVPARQDGESPAFQYFALTAILVESFTRLDRWKAAKEALGRYRIHFPRDPWGYRLGAEVTRQDPDVKDRDAVARAAEMLEAEARRLEQSASTEK